MQGGHNPRTGGKGSDGEKESKDKNKILFFHVVLLFIMICSDRTILLADKGLLNRLSDSIIPNIVFIVNIILSVVSILTRKPI